MESFVIYLLKASALLGIFYLSYLILLERETSFNLNRKFLLGGLIASGVLPVIYFTRKVYLKANTQNFSFISDATVTPVPADTPIDWWQITGVIYLIVTVFFLLRFANQLKNILRVIYSNDFEQISGLKYLKTTGDQLPFSFFNYIIFNPSIHTDKDLELIMEHEKIHAQQLHSIDIVLVNLVSCILWFNPFSWWYKRSIEQNLEFIADRETVVNTTKIKEYQHALIKVSVANLKPALTSHFYQSFIKKRILMLNKKSSNQYPAWKLSLVMPLLLAFMLLFNVKTEAQIKNTEDIKGSGSTGDAETEISVTITSNTSEKSLKHFSKVFKKRHAILKFEDIERSNEGMLTNITIRFQDLEIGNKGEITKNDPAGIESFVIFQNSKNGIGFRAANPFHSRTMMNKNGDIISQIGTSPLYIINGKEYTSASLQNKFIGFEGNLEALIPKLAIEKYGQKAKDGVVIVKNGKIIENFSKELKRIDSENKDFYQNFLEINSNYVKPVLITLDNRSDRKDKKTNKKTSAINEKSGRNKEPVSVEVTGMGFYTEEPEETKHSVSQKDIIAYQSHNATSKISDYDMIYGSGSKETNILGTQIVRISPPVKKIAGGVNFNKQAGKPIYIVNGMAMDENFDINTIEASDVSSITVLKGKTAVDAYGEIARNGALQIFTKSYTGNEEPAPAESRFIAFSGTISNSELENIAQEIKKNLHIVISFSNLERNEEGLITAIKVSGIAKDGQKAAATFQNTTGISSILIGFDKNDELVISSNQLE